MPRRCAIAAAVFRRAEGKMLALLQPLTKQTRAPNDSNKPAAVFRSASCPAGTVGCYGRRSGGFGTPAGLGVPGPPGGAVPAAARGEPARPRSARSELGCNSGTPSAPPGGQCKAPRPVRPGGNPGEIVYRFSPPPRGLCPTPLSPRRPAPPLRPRRGKVDIYFCLFWGL